jgi:surfactin synthase thioesterase subunit
LLLPTLRADLTLCETYEYHPEPPLQCPISAYGATEDPRVTAEEVLGWAAHTASTFSLRFFAGGHFFINSARQAVLDALAYEAAETLARTLGNQGDGRS